MAKFITICPRCMGKGRYDRGSCYGCHQYGGNGWVERSKAKGTPVVVTAIRSEAEGPIEWVKIYGAVPSDAVAIVQRQMRAKGRPDALVASVACATKEAAP